MSEIQLLIQRIATTPNNSPCCTAMCAKPSPDVSPTASIFVSGISTSSCWLCFTARAIQRYGNSA